MKNGLMFLILLLTCSISYSQELSISLFLDKDIYLKSEPVEAVAEFSNISDHTISIEDFWIDCGPTQFETILTDESGKRLFSDMSSISDFSIGKAYIELQPKETRYYMISLSYCFGQDHKNNISVYGHPSFLTGKYNLKAVYRTTSSEQDTSVKEYFSDVKQFSVVEPEDADDKTVIEKIKSVCKGQFPIRERDKLIQELKSLINNYPNSNYTQVAMRELTKIANIQDKEMENLVLKQIEKYPDSFITFGIIDKYMRDRNEFLLNNKIEEKLGSKIRKYVDYYRKEKEKGIERRKKLQKL